MAKLFTIKFTKSAYRHLEAFRRFDRNRILAVGIKKREKMFIGGEEIVL